jgi:hypothetical protein
MMMKSRTLFFITIGLLILGIAAFIFSTRDQEPEQLFPATIDRDCAPWDGGAFTVKIPISDGTVIDISIWQSPEIKLPVTFLFPDGTGQVGNAILTNPVGLPDPLTGTVYFWNVNQDHPVEGKFELRTESGEVFKGQFKAEWGTFIALCG